MRNPLSIATQGKNFFPMLARGRTIASRYGLTPLRMTNALKALMEPLSQYACSATIPVTASALAANPAAKKQSFQGVELAVHGLHHLDYSLLSLEQQLKHLHEARAIFQRMEIPVTGFRCPYLRWNEDTLTALKETGFTYDSSQALAWDVVGGLSTGAYLRVLDFYGAQSANTFPALPSWSDGLIRIPYSLPDDESLIDRLHITNAALMADIWLAMLDRAYESGELFTLGLHPERALACQGALQAVLLKARSLGQEVWVARLDEIAAWYGNLGHASFELENDGGGLYYIRIYAPERATVLARSPEIIAETQPWKKDFQIVLSNQFFLKCDKRPVLGLAPGSPSSLVRFLRCEGYLVELSTDPGAYTVYLDRNSFDPKDERSLLAELEQSNRPLVRLSRWPDAARCALAITGDVDAFTIWDYAKRVLVNQ